jgi:hypothetical protein
MEPERQIEQWLRAFARKRRAGTADFKLHPATRRQLQDEVARQYAGDAAPEESVSLWQFFRQQWPLVISFTLLMFFLGSLFVPALKATKLKARRMEAASHLKEIGAAAQIAAGNNNGRLPDTLDALTNGLLAGTILTDPLSKKPFVYVAGGETLDLLQSNSVLAYSPEDKKGRAVLLADGSVNIVSEKKFEELNQRGLLQRVSTPQYAAAPAATTALDKAKSGTDESSAQFKAITPTGAPTNTVLANFEIRLAGNTLAIVDRDGSVYRGTSETTDNAATAIATAPATGIQFRVSGLNQTTKQSIVFTGTLIPAPGASTATPFDNARITGTVTIGETNRVEIQAVPAAP